MSAHRSPFSGNYVHYIDFTAASCSCRIAPVAGERDGRYSRHCRIRLQLSHYETAGGGPHCAIHGRQKLLRFGRGGSLSAELVQNPFECLARLRVPPPLIAPSEPHQGASRHIGRGGAVIRERPIHRNRGIKVAFNSLLLLCRPKLNVRRLRWRGHQSSREKGQDTGAFHGFLLPEAVPEYGPKFDIPSRVCRRFVISYSAGSNRYPSPRTLTRVRGSAGLDSIFLRRLDTWLSTTRSVTARPRPQTSSNNCSRESSLPRFRINAPSSLNSSALISSGLPARRNSPRVKSTSISPNAKRRFESGCALARRRSARMRARSSCGLKGLVT